jgi:RNA polymerase sigma-70 factor, ECF subfamily
VNALAERQLDHPHEDVLRQMFDEHGRALLTFATRITGNRPAAEDVVQETMLRAWRHIDRLSDGSGARGWLLTVARNAAIDRARTPAVRAEKVTAAPHQPVAQADHAESVASTVDMLAALRSLSDKHRQILFQLYYNDLTAAEAAAHLGIPVGTAKSRAHHALRSLREILNKQARTGGTDAAHASDTAERRRRPDPKANHDAAADERRLPVQR